MLETQVRIAILLGVLSRKTGDELEGERRANGESGRYAAVLGGKF